MKKRILRTLASGVIVFLILALLRPFEMTQYKISFETYCKDEIDIQVFYAETLDDFSADSSLTYTLEPKSCITMNSKIQNPDNNQLRIDLGQGNNQVKVKNLIVSDGIHKTSVDLTECDYKNDIQQLSYSDDGIIVETNADDPYIVYDLTSILSGFKAWRSNIVWGIYALIAFIVGLFVFVRYEKVKIVAKWIKDIVVSRNIILKLAKNDFKTRFAASYLGVIWAFVQPIVTIVIYVFVFQYGFRSQAPVVGVSYVLWLVAGIVPWFYFMEGVNSATNSLIEYSYLVKKIVFKINVLPVVKIISALFVHLFFIVVALCLYFAQGMDASIYLIQILYYSFCTTVLMLGISYFTSAVMVFFRDLGQIVNILLQFGMWLTPIMWDISMLAGGGKKIAGIMQLNPMYYIVKGYRDSFYSHIWFWEQPNLTLYFWSVTLIIFVIGIYVFRKLEKHFADVL